MNPNTIHFIGIGGIGMSGIARFYLSLGFKVQGSDIKKTPILEELEKLDAKLFIGHNAENISGADLVVYSSSIKENHCERVAATTQNIPIIHRADALARLCEGKLVIAVTGTHGKTTTTALIGSILKKAGLNPSVVVGGWVRAFGGNALIGKSSLMVIEADESDASFLKFSPQIQVITNIEAEHMDHYKSLEAVKKAYADFIDRLPEDGECFGCGEDANFREISKSATRRVTFYGLENQNAIYATDIVECPQGKKGLSFKVWKGKTFLGEANMQLLGMHNVCNALAAIGVAQKFGIGFSMIAQALAGFEGAGRRFDVKLDNAQVLIVDDYAHHPTEIQKTLAAAKSLKKPRIVALFQPHRYTRTQLFLNDFSKSFFDADKVIITDIYAASEAPIDGVNGQALCQAAQDSGHKDVTFVRRAELTEYAQNQIKPGDLLITMGAGDISEVAAQVSEGLLKLDNHISTVTSPVFSEIRGKVLCNEPLYKHTSLRVGGPADYWIEPTDEDALRQTLKILKASSVPFFIFGAGSNLLPPDAGIRGAVIHLGSPYFREIGFDGKNFSARAGVVNSLFIREAINHGLGGCEFLSGIPGDIGGSIMMNAGSHGQWIDSILSAVRVMDYSGEVKVLKREEINFSYRKSDLKNLFILEGIFSLPAKSSQEVQDKLNQYHAHRVNTQDLAHPSAGCMFKNPDIPGSSSGKLIDEAGLKGLRLGNAQVSTRHANFIVNLGGATAKDILDLMDMVRQAVKRHSNIELETEVKIL